MRSYNNLNLTNDIDRNHSLLLESIKDKKILIIGGAGSIGAYFIKEILRYEPSKITVVDNNENALTELTKGLKKFKYIRLQAGIYNLPSEFTQRHF